MCDCTEERQCAYHAAKYAESIGASLTLESAEALAKGPPDRRTADDALAVLEQWLKPHWTYCPANYGKPCDCGRDAKVRAYGDARVREVLEKATQGMHDADSNVSAAMLIAGQTLDRARRMRHTG